MDMKLRRKIAPQKRGNLFDKLCRTRRKTNAIESRLAHSDWVSYRDDDNIFFVLVIL
jgi:hypothetical protein